MSVHLAVQVRQLDSFLKKMNKKNHKIVFKKGIRHRLLTLPDVSPSVFNGGVPVDVGELTEAEPVVVMHRGVGESVHVNCTGLCMVHFAHPRVQFVVRDTAPKRGFLAS